MTSLQTSVSFQTTQSRNTDGLQFGRITINEDYRKKWRIDMGDFVCLTMNGELLRPTLYRIGGLGPSDPQKHKYFMLLKHVEAQYSKEFMDSVGDRGSKNPNHLESRWCILDQQGNEKVEFKEFSSPYLVADSCIYSIDQNYYNIETGELYGNTYNSFSSKEFLFLHLPYEKDAAKCGVMKINKKDGSFEVFH